MRVPSHPAVLIVVPTLGTRLGTLKRTLGSIECQGSARVDIVVVCPESRSELLKIVGDHGALLVVWQGHISSAVNEGWRSARPEHRYVAWIGDDDVIRPGALDRAVAVLEHDPRCTVAYGTCDYIDLDGGLLFKRRPPPGAPWWLQLVPGLIKQETCLFRRDAVAAVGGLDERLRYAMDLDLLLRLRRLGPFARVDATQAGFCWHAGSLTIGNRGPSLVEAQEIQRVNVTGPMRLLVAFAQPVLRTLLHIAYRRIDRRSLRND